MKVLYIAHSSGLQGAGYALINILKGVIRHGIEPVLLLPQQGPISDVAKKLGIKCYYHKCYNSTYPAFNNIKDYILFPIRLLFTCLTNYLAQRNLERITRIEKPDLIHSNTGVIRFGAKVAKKHKIPHIWHIREYQTLDFNWIPIGGIKYQKKLYSEKNNHCISITKDVFNYFQLDNSKDVVIYDGVFSEDIKRPIISKGNYFLFVGCLKVGKGILDVIDAFDKVANELPSDIELWLAGNDEVNIKNVIQKTACPQKIKYLGFRKDVYELMANAKALIVPSMNEGFGFITAEAMLNHCLVIGRNTGGTKEQFDNGVRQTGKEIGLRFSTNQELSNIINVVANSDNDYIDLIARAHKVVLSLYRTDINIENLIDYYSQVQKMTI